MITSGRPALIAPDHYRIEVITHPLRQRGVILFVALVMLLVMTLLGVTGMRVTTLEEKMAGNMRDRSLAFQAAERALRAGEAEAAALVDMDGFVDDQSHHRHARGDAPDPFADATWTDPGTRSIALDGAGGRYFIEAIGDVTAPRAGTVTPGVNGDPDDEDAKITALRVVARGTGMTGSASVVLQTYYGRLLPPQSAADKDGRTDASDPFGSDADGGNATANDRPLSPIMTDDVPPLEPHEGEAGRGTRTATGSRAEGRYAWEELRKD